ncbi:CatB-related O-acetyltransferase [Altibacter sp. HG106]|uniref:CatB-related O-acetyltransferase n=1 Tax=Altibacter sp. HG106 TaxID=3023937 RepID=UPI00235047E8|nr:CatB-related O-acetyltransferase [Altibacter sp. HG106]MDC7995364.1 CatB-related O-acetyltransferase [Altibacter sp. HG106]
MIVFKGRKATIQRWILKIASISNNSGTYIGRGSRIVNGFSIGEGSRVNGAITVKGSGRCHIGKYCAIGDQVKIITSNHSTQTVNLQYALAKKLGFSSPMDEKKDVTIQHNVWIGDNALILPGVTIGNGAVIAAGSIVTKDIPPYAIVAGVPAKVKRFRFEEEKIRHIEALEWWHWTHEEMKNHPELFQ